MRIGLRCWFFLQICWLWYALSFTSAILRSVIVDLFLSLQIHCQRFQYRSGILLAFWLGYQTKSPSRVLGVMQIGFLMARRSDYFPFWNFCFNEDMILVFECDFRGFVHLHDLHTWGWNSSFINQSGVFDYYLHSMNFVFIKICDFIFFFWFDLWENIWIVTSANDFQDLNCENQICFSSWFSDLYNHVCMHDFTLCLRLVVYVRFVLVIYLST